MHGYFRHCGGKCECELKCPQGLEYGIGSHGIGVMGTWDCQEPNVDPMPKSSSKYSFLLIYLYCAIKKF